jgi:hypothetical protein
MVFEERKKRNSLATSKERKKRNSLATSKGVDVEASEKKRRQRKMPLI